MESYKIIYLLWAPRGQEKGRTRDILMGDVSLKLIGAGAERLTLHIADPESDIRPPAPKLYRGRPISAMASILVDDPGARRKIEDTLRYSGFTIAGYLVEESIYTDYGGNSHAAPRNWPDGRRSPGVVTVNLLERPRRLTREEWIRRWHGIMSPVSEEIQPRARYVRNLVVETLTPGAHPFEGIVEECWPSKKHVTSSYLFYGAKNPLQVFRNMCRILRAVKSFLDISKIRTTVMGEYFIKTS
ncbi:MAG: EthD domain-containing protein [Spirochaetes bacterium]|nr:EthD domain-containing protein [Spirochaetota bacterium]